MTFSFALKSFLRAARHHAFASPNTRFLCILRALPHRVSVCSLWACNLLIGTFVTGFRAHTHFALNFFYPFTYLSHVPVVSMKYVQQALKRVFLGNAPWLAVHRLKHVLLSGKALDQFHNGQANTTQQQHDAQQ